MLIVLGSDDRYALPLSVTVHSALTSISGDEPVTVMVVDAGISRQSRQKIERVISNARPTTVLRWKKPSMDQFEGMRTTHWGSLASYLPLLLPSLVEDETHLLYLDSDLLVRHDLSALWQLGINDSRSQVLAVLDYGFHTLGEALKGDACARLGLDADAPYFNSGVLMVNLDMWRQNKTAERAFSFAREHPEVMRFTDQDALNAVVQGEWSQLDLRWNVLVGSIDRLVERNYETPAERQEAKKTLSKSPYILHFSGSQKPWRAGYRGVGKRDYAEELRASRWFNNAVYFRRWRAKVALASPFVEARRGAVRTLWPLVKRVRAVREGKPSV
jgi:lipopolysaccharide biosynthesis glycosyltransferase